MTTSYLITGGAGFIGSHLSELLVNQGYQVVAIDNLSTGRLENLRSLQSSKNFQFMRESILNARVMDRLASQSDIIVHLAAAVGVKLIVEDPVHTIETNIMGSEMVLRTANRYSCKVLIASSSEVYGKGSHVPFAEEDDCLIGPTSHSRWAYATSKAIDEFLGLAYFHQFGLPVVVMRLFNTIGPRQTGKYGMVVPRFVRWAIQGKPIQVHGDGRQSRCFSDVQDVCRAVALLAEHPQAVGEVFNIGNQEEVTIMELAKRVIQLSGSHSEIRLLPYDQAYAPGFEDMRRRVPSVEKIRRLIGFTPESTLDDALRRVIDWERRHSKTGEQAD